jgi:hypothetical protein
VTSGFKPIDDPLAVPIPLADGTAAMVYLPQKLSHADADKIARVVKAMACDAWQSALTREK